MLRYLSLFLILIAFCGLDLLSRVYAQPRDVRSGIFTGRVYEAEGGAGIPNLAVKLTPPKGSDRPNRITTTDKNGGFRFTNLERERYLLEVSQGVQLLYRDVVDATKEDTRKEIALRRKRQ